MSTSDTTPPDAPTTARPPHASSLVAEPDPVIELEEVTKRVGDAVLLDAVSLSVEPSEIYGLVGPSGSGKTTLVRMLVGLLQPSSGAVSVNGVAPSAFSASDRRRIGYTPQSFSLYPTLTVWENARFMAGLYGLGWRHRRRRIRTVLQFLELWDARKNLAQDISGGMQRRLALAGALLHEPELLIVDEPAAGLDPLLRERIWTYLSEVQSSGTTVFLTTQYIEEAERCDVVAVLSGGSLIDAASPAALRAKAGLPDELAIEVEDVRAPMRSLSCGAWTASAQWSGPEERGCSCASMTR